MPIPAGKRNRRVTVERFTPTQDPGSGQNVETWATLATLWASWRRASARETLAASEISAQVTDIFELPWTTTTDTITPLDRLTFKGRTYNIAEATEINLREGVLIKASARAE
jgi:SPP1 family predicted phage head-tail adaptor